jgi:uncharacterized integral membrane protein
MRAIALFVLLILLVAAVFFSMANRGMTSIGFWPLDIRFDMPLFLPILGALVVGFVAGWIGCWNKAGQVRRQLRQSMRDNRDAAIEIDRLKEEVKRAQSSGGAAPPQIAA